MIYAIMEEKMQCTSNGRHGVWVPRELLIALKSKSQKHREFTIYVTHKVECILWTRDGPEWELLGVKGQVLFNSSAGFVTGM